MEVTKLLLTILLPFQTHSGGHMQLCLFKSKLKSFCKIVFLTFPTYLFLRNVKSPAYYLALLPSCGSIFRCCTLLPSLGSIFRGCRCFGVID